MNAQTMQRWPSTSKGNGRKVSRPLPFVRYAALRDRCAAVMRDLFPRHLKGFDGLSAHKLSEWRNTGGGLGDLCVLMFANPTKAQALAAFVADVARTVTATQPMCFLEASRAEQSCDGEEDVAQMEAILDQSAANLERYLRVARAERAALDDNIAAAEQLLESKR